jgi:3'(2'), 5'-bisphosphate nucleotidase
MVHEQIFAEREKIFSVLSKAAAAILQVYENSETIEKTLKNDGSPLTLADKAAHRIIEEQLTKLYPQIPLLSEEGAEIPVEIRQKWATYWCLDPLDGTKEFIKRNGEFAVCLALITNNEAVAGFILPPVQGEIYFGIKGKGAFKKDKNEREIPLKVSGKKDNMTAIGSRSHAQKEDEIFLHKFSVGGFTAKGSALKFCIIAEGEADFYYRSGPTMEWDTAAGQAILEAAGGAMYLENGERMMYNKDSLRNPSFYCLPYQKN